ncbi:GTP cyclohydrolase II [Mycolicibacterium lutetiense]
MNEAIAAALCDLAEGKMVVVTDDENRENEGDLVMAASHVTAESIAFMVRNTTGILCAPMSEERCAELVLPQMVSTNTDPHRTAFTVSVDSVSTSTGVSSEDRARTLRALSDTSTMPTDLRRPGHVFPLQARAGGVLERPGHTEASVDLLTLAAVPPVAVIGEIVSADGAMARDGGLQAFARQHRLVTVSIAELAAHLQNVDRAAKRSAFDRRVEIIGTAKLPTSFGVFQAAAFRSDTDGADHLALTLGDVAAHGSDASGVLVRVHSECVTGEVMESLRCDCGDQLRQAMSLISQEGVGALVYLRGHEGRGIGLAQKIRAYALQDCGSDTVDANTALGLPIDGRDYSIVARILASLGIRNVRLITNNPDKCLELGRHGIDMVRRVSTVPSTNSYNIDYLRAKRDRLGHLLDLGAGPTDKSESHAPIDRQTARVSVRNPDLFRC